MAKTRSLLMAFLMMIGAVSGTVVTASSAHAGTICWWETFGVSSNCDGEWSGNIPGCVAWMHEVRSNTISDGRGNWMHVSLRYSRNPNSDDCRTVEAWMWTSQGSASGPCYVKVERNYGNPHAIMYGGAIVTGDDSLFAETAMLYDKNVTSFAWAHCEINGSVLRGGTSSY